MTQQHGATRRASGHFVQKWRVWGANPNKHFSSGKPLELLAGTVKVAEQPELRRAFGAG